MQPLATSLILGTLPEVVEHHATCSSMTCNNKNGEDILKVRMVFSAELVSQSQKLRTQVSLHY
eukprot:1917812-Amphidinium_carterae.1